MYCIKLCEFVRKNGLNLFDIVTLLLFCISELLCEENEKAPMHFGHLLDAFSSPAL